MKIVISGQYQIIVFEPARNLANIFGDLLFGRQTGMRLRESGYGVEIPPGAEIIYSTGYASWSVTERRIEYLKREYRINENL